MQVIYAEGERPKPPRCERHFRRECPGHGLLQLTHEHGQWWVSCLRCGALWSVENEHGPNRYFEAFERGDGYCDDTTQVSHYPERPR